MAVSIDELKAMSKEDIENLSGIKCLQAGFENGPNGRKIEMSEFKELPQKERESLVSELRPVLIETAKV